MNCPFQRAFIFCDYVYVIRKSQVVYSYSVYRYSVFAIFDSMTLINKTKLLNGNDFLVRMLYKYSY